MSRLSKVDAIAKALQNVPLPIVQQVATVTDMVLTIVEQEHDVNLTEEKGLLASFAAAREPWQTIHDRATSIATAAELGAHTGSTGE